MPFVSRLAAVLAVALVAGCAAPAQPEGDVGRQSQADGQSETYTYVLDSSCGERSLVGRFRIEVVDGSMVAVEGLDDTGRAAVDQDGADEAPTIADLLDEAATPSTRRRRGRGRDHPRRPSHAHHDRRRDGGVRR